MTISLVGSIGVTIVVHPRPLDWHPSMVNWMTPVLGPVTSPASCILLHVNFAPPAVSIVASVLEFSWMLNLGVAPGQGSHSNLCSEAVACTVQLAFLNA